MDDLLDAIALSPRPPRPSRQDLVGGGLPGIPLDRLTWPFRRSREKKKPHVRSPAARFYARFPRYVDATKLDEQTPEEWWDKGGWLDIPYKALAAVFTPDELTRLWWSAAVSSKVCDHLYDRDEEHPLDHVVWKVRHAMWMWGWSDDYNLLVDAYEGLRRLSFGEGFEVRLDHTNSINERGTAVYTRNAPPKPVWLDGEFGLLVYYKGKHVLTVGFSPTAAGVLVHQVQLREKRGNRFIYKLPKPYLEHTLDCFRAAFPTLPVLLIDGAEAVHRIRQAYGKRAKEDFDPTGAPERIQAFYDQPLGGYERVPVEKGAYARCSMVVPRAAVSSLAA